MAVKHLYYPPRGFASREVVVYAFNFLPQSAIGAVPVTKFQGGQTNVNKTAAGTYSVTFGSASLPEKFSSLLAAWVDFVGGTALPAASASGQLLVPNITTVTQANAFGSASPNIVTGLTITTIANNAVLVAGVNPTAVDQYLFTNGCVCSVMAVFKNTATPE